MSHQLTTIAFGLLLLNGCQSYYIEDYHPKIMEQKQLRHNWQPQANDTLASTQLTQLVRDSQLDSLIEQAQVANPNLQQTLLSLRISYAQRQQARGNRLPSAEITLNTDDSDHGTNNDAELGVSWELDLWRKLADADNAAKLAIASSEASSQHTQTLLVANVMRGYLDYSLQQQLILLEQQRLQLLQNNEAVILQRYRNGLGDLESLDNAKTNSASTRASITIYQQQLANSLRNLQRLTGNSELRLNDVTTFPAAQQPLASLPEQDLSQRPDLQAAYYDTQRAYYNSRVAYKSMLPSINLKAALSDSASSMSDALFTNPAWSLLAQLTAPLYQGGKLKAAAEIAELESAQSYWRYRETLLAAILEVDAGIDNERLLSQQLHHLNDAVNSAQRSSDNYLKKYRQGLVDIVDLLSVQQQLFDIQSQQLQANYSHLSNRIDLGLALGLGAH